MNSDNLKPCPFCGGNPYVSAYDRGINIGCRPCGYQRLFDGLLSTQKSDVPITKYKGDNGEIIEIPASHAKEWYHSDAHERAEEQWNIRATLSQESE